MGFRKGKEARKTFQESQCGEGRGEEDKREQEGRTCGQFGKESLARHQTGSRSICDVLYTVLAYLAAGQAPSPARCSASKRKGCFPNPTLDPL